MRGTMADRLCHLLLALALAFISVPCGAAAPREFRWATKSDALTLDPHGANEAVTLGLLGNVYEALTRYDDRLTLKPALAEAWERRQPTTWRFALRRGVRFHNGNPFTADDVIFSWRRAAGDTSDVRVYARKAVAIRKLDDYTIEIDTPAPNPLLPRDLAFLYIMDEEWARQHGAETAVGIGAGELANFAGLQTNGTGPFRVSERHAELKTVLQRVAEGGREVDGDLVDGRVDVAVMMPIATDSTRVAALMSGSVDAIADVPIQDWRRIANTTDLALFTTPEARTIFLGFDQARPALRHASVQDRNPFQDRRVRAAFAHAIDVPLISEKMMGGAAKPAGLLVAPEIQGFSARLNQPYPYDPERAKMLLAEAGLGQGFSVTLDCPNNRYVNDERTCQAVAAMLAKVGVAVDVLAQPKGRFFAKVLSGGGFDTSFFLLGWVPVTFDSLNVLVNLAACRALDAGRGQFNLGGYCNAEVDALIRDIEVEMDEGRRQQLIERAFSIIRDDVGFIPLYQPPVSLAARRGIHLQVRPDGVLYLKDVVLKDVGVP
jgi:peptide/nickel transport system substrate-binding protein